MAEPIRIDHLTLPVADMRRERAFYEAALGALGMKVNAEYDGAIGLGSDGEKHFWLAARGHAHGEKEGVHVAFCAATKKQVDAFHRAALGAGGKDHGKPGPRPDYGDRYYAAFVIDPEGNNVEVVCYE